MLTKLFYFDDQLISLHSSCSSQRESTSLDQHRLDTSRSAAQYKYAHWSHGPPHASLLKA